MLAQVNQVERDQVTQQPMIRLKKVTRMDKMAMRLQQAYRSRMGRGILRRFQKLKVFRLETIAGITLQCFFRLKLAQKEGTISKKVVCVCVCVCLAIHTCHALEAKKMNDTCTQNVQVREPRANAQAHSYYKHTQKIQVRTRTHTLTHTHTHSLITPALLSATRKRALAHYKRFMLTSKPDLKMNWSEDEMETLAAIMMQAAWRRRQVLPVVCPKEYVYARV